MKKSLIALAVMAAAGAASAQSSVTLFGIVDATISYQKVGSTATTPAVNKTVMSNSGYNSSRLGFRGTEDLGGGMSASFWLEGALSNDDGTPGGFMFRRRSTVSLAGNWGEVRLGRDYTPNFWNVTVFDPFGTNGVGTNTAHKVKNAGATVAAVGIVDPTNVRSDNMVGYFLPPNLGGIYGQLNYAFDEQPSTAGNHAGRYIGGRAGYASGPANAAIAFGNTKGAQTSLATPEVKDWNIGGQWDFGVAKLLGLYDHAKYDSGAFGNGTLKSYVIGTLVPVGAGEIRASYSRSKFSTSLATVEPRVSQWALGYVHNLSKRTALYATYAHVSNRDGSSISVGSSLSQGLTTGATNASSSGFDLGIRHSF